MTDTTTMPTNNTNPDHDKENKVTMQPAAETQQPVKRGPGRPRKDPNAPPTQRTKKPKAAAVAVREVHSTASSVDREAIAELEERVLDLSDSWETESLYADAIDEITHDKVHDATSGMLPPLLLSSPRHHSR